MLCYAEEETDVPGTVNGVDASAGQRSPLLTYIHTVLSQGLMQYPLVSRRGRQRLAFQVKPSRGATGTQRRGGVLLKAEEVDQLMLQVEGSNTSDLFLKVCQAEIQCSGSGFNPERPAFMLWPTMTEVV